MPVQPTYPGVYLEEVPSGVRTIMGVSTATAVFIGRTKQGPMNEPRLCLNYGDFERIFSSERAGSDLPRQVRMFFMNGGTRCYVVRIAKDPRASKIVLQSEGGVDVLTAEAKSPGLRGDMIRIGVGYSGEQPESTFNLEFFRWGKTPQGDLVKEEDEVWNALSMNPDSPRYAVTFVNQNSSLITLKAEAGATVGAAVKGYSRSGRPMTNTTDAKFKTAMLDILNLTGTPKRSRFRISVAGGAFVDVDLSAIDTTADILDEIRDVINASLPSSTQVAVTRETGPAPAAGTTAFLRIESTAGDVRIEPAATDDLASALMLGTAQGGFEVSKWALVRPAPNGIVFDAEAHLADFGGLQQGAFDTLTLDATDISLKDDPYKIRTVSGTAKMYEDALSTVITDHNDGVREKWAIIRNAVNAKRAADRNFPWIAEVWGSRLALIPVGAGDSFIGTISTSKSGVNGTDIGSYFNANIRYCSLGGPVAGFQDGPVTGLDGNPPGMEEYVEAWKAVDREVDLYNLMILPKDDGHLEAFQKSLWGPASIECKRRRAFLLIDPPDKWRSWDATVDAAEGVASLRVGLVKDHSAVFFPRITIRENGLQYNIGPSGTIAGLMSRIDTEGGVWRAPAGLTADLRGIVGLELRLSDAENGVLNPRAVNTLRVFPAGIVNWGARTMDGDDDFGSEWKYIPIRRLALYIEESLFRGTQFAVFMPNAEPLWAQIRLAVGSFMATLFRQGAFAGTSPREAYFVKCDEESTPQNDRDRGIVNIIVGFAPLKPAEFVIIKITQMAGRLQT